MTATTRYDTIGATYATARAADPRLATAIHGVLGEARRVVNVGAGTGNYEPTDREVIAVEPSPVMISQRRAGAAPAVRAPAERLPFADDTFDAALAISTVHHWTDRPRGLAEMARVAPRRLVVHWEPADTTLHWIVEDYFPELAAVESVRDGGTSDDVATDLGGDVEVHPFPVPIDFADGAGGAFWGRPEALLDPEVRSGISMFALLDPEIVERRVTQLAADLPTGRWDDRHGHLRTLDTLDVGLRVIVSTDLT
ncbi:MAG: class I SAM-dependent methyltransferase [Acidimicrobiales bacterium]